MSKAGIWIDTRTANLIFILNKEATTVTIRSEIEEYHPKGGSRTRKTPWGPMQKMDERKYLQRKNQQHQQYFDSILDRVKDVDELYIFGPSEAKQGLRKHLNDSSIFKGIILAVETADAMTENQKIAQVKEFFQIL